MKKIAIVILNWNGAEMLRSFLPSVVQYSTGAEVEIWVADNASTDDSLDVLRTKFPSVRTLVLEENYGFADGYNRALARIEAEYVVLLNSDVEVTPGWLEPLLAYMEGHPEAAACQPKIRSQLHPDFFEYAGAAGGFIDRYGYPFCRGRLFAVVEKDKNQYEDIVPVFWASGAALCIRRADFFEVGGFDARFFAHMEEIDLCWRLRSRGRQIVCVPQSVVYHVGAATLKKDNPRKTFLNFRNNLLMLYKNLPEPELKRVLRVRRVLDAVAIIVFLLKGDRANAEAVWSARKEFDQIRYSFASSRVQNLVRATVDEIPERLRFSLLWKYYVWGKKRFSQLGIG